MHNNDKNKIKSLLDVWKVIEILTPSPSKDLKLYLKDREELKEGGLRRKEYESQKETLYLFEDISSVMDNRPEEDDDNEIWWKVYIGAINWGVAEKKIFGKDESEELIKNNNSLIIPTLGFIMGNDKKIVKESITLSTAAWALGKIISDDFDDNRITELIDFERDSLNIKQAILSSCFSEDNFEKIFELKNTIAELLGIPEDFFIKPCDICIRKTIKKTKKLRKRKLNEEEECKEDIKYRTCLKLTALRDPPTI